MTGGSGIESEIRKDKKKPKVMRPMAFLLPHELLHVLGVEGDPSTLASKVGLDVTTQRHVTNVESSLNRAVVPLGLWADGVPLSWDRKRSMECWVMSLPGLPSDKGRQLRFPLVAYPADLQSVRTSDAIMGVLSASLVASLEGRFPVVRLDGAIFKEGDSWRKKRGGRTGFGSVWCGGDDSRGLEVLQGSRANSEWKSMQSRGWSSVSKVLSLWVGSEFVGDQRSAGSLCSSGRVTCSGELVP